MILLDILNIPPQSQLISEVEIVSEHDHLLLWKRLSEAIGDLIRSADESDVQAPLLQLVHVQNENQSLYAWCVHEI